MQKWIRRVAAVRPAHASGVEGAVEQRVRRWRMLSRARGFGVVDDRAAPVDAGELIRVIRHGSAVAGGVEQRMGRWRLAPAMLQIVGEGIEAGLRHIRAQRQIVSGVEQRMGAAGATPAGFDVVQQRMTRCRIAQAIRPPVECSVEQRVGREVAACADGKKVQQRQHSADTAAGWSSHLRSIMPAVEQGMRIRSAGAAMAQIMQERRRERGCSRQLRAVEGGVEQRVRRAALVQAEAEKVRERVHSGTDHVGVTGEIEAAVEQLVHLLAQVGIECDLGGRHRSFMRAVS